jgi:hypothetical protein
VQLNALAEEVQLVDMTQGAPASDYLSVSDELDVLS